ncbi:serine/threonine-protein kinase [Actinomadura scrupuli]|uniref:serine/threonine-protein kinase n=1 Tax=Actinomadura scrupuli TaxID=559629 RepID=UPI003D968736
MAEWRVPGFVELRELGAGGQGRAVLVREERSDRPAVLKYVRYAGDRDALDRFRQESVLLKRVRSPYVAQWFGHFEDTADAAILMEAVDGVSLRDVLAEKTSLTPEAALAILKGSLLGLAAAHAVGVVHHDYKPANVVVTGDGHSKLIDFGIAALAGSSAGGSGTPPYMAPEQWESNVATPATDVYAATCVFFECVTGRQPYLAPSQPMLRYAHASAPIPVETVDEALRPLLTHGLAKAPEERPASAAEFVAELETVATAAYGTDWEDRGIRALAISAAALAALFPLAALTLSIGGAASGGAGAAGVGAVSAAGAGTAGSGAASAGGTVAGKSLLGKLTGVKAAVAAGTTAVGAAAVIAAVVVAAPTKKASAPAPTPAASIVLQSFSYQTMKLRLPQTWKTTTLTTGTTIDDQVGISPGNGCRIVHYWQTGCPHVRIMGSKSIDFYFGDGTPYDTTRGGYFPAGGIMQCPGTKLWMYGSSLINGRSTWKAVQVGGREARYWEFQVPCGPKMPTGTEDKATLTFTQREWYLPQAKILVITNGPIPGWDAILTAAQWT